MKKGSCWLFEHGEWHGRGDMPACDGRLVRVHLIARQVIRRAGGDVLDPRSFVPGCGGITGIGGHHGALDYSRHLRIPRDQLDAELIEFAVELDLVWYLDREYAVPRTVKSG